MKTLDKTLSWEVEELPIFDQLGEPITGYKRLINSESQSTLSVCKESYTPTKNERLLEVTHLLSDKMGFSIEGFASFKDGKKVLAYLKNTNAEQLLGLNVQDYMIVGNSHDGTTSFFTGMTNYIYRCTNMFSSTQKQTKVYHTKGHDSKINESLHYHDLYYNERTGFYEMMEEFEQTPITPKYQNLFVNNVLQLEDKQELSTRMQNIQDKLNDCIQIETSDLGNNVFGLFNGLTRYTSNELTTKNPVFGNPFGHAQTLNKRGIAFCQNLLKEIPKKTIHVLPRHAHF